MEKYVAFIGSNARPLYVHNIYQCLSYPNNQVLQYRYQTQFVSEKIRNNPKKYINKKGVIIYYYRPQLKDSYQGTIQNITEDIALPIREVLIKDIQINKEVDQVNFFLELKEFVDFKDDISILVKNHVNQGKFAKTAIFNATKKKSWVEKIKSVEKYFENIHFFHINKIEGDKFEIEYDQEVNQTRLSLMDDSSYIFEFLTYDKTEGKSPIIIETDKDYIKVIDKLETGTKVNSKRLKFETRSIDFKKDSTYILIQDLNAKFPVNISVKIKKRLKKSFLWGISSSILLISIPFTNIYIANKLNSGNLIGLFFTFAILALVIGYLHRSYNKK